MMVLIKSTRELHFGLLAKPRQYDSADNLFLIMNQTELRSVLNQQKNCRYDNIYFNKKTVRVYYTRTQIHVP